MWCGHVQRVQADAWCSTPFPVRWAGARNRTTRSRHRAVSHLVAAGTGCRPPGGGRPRSRLGTWIRPPPTLTVTVTGCASSDPYRMALVAASLTARTRSSTTSSGMAAGTSAKLCRMARRSSARQLGEPANEVSMSCPLPALRLLPWADAMVWPRLTRSRAPRLRAAGAGRAGSGSAWQAEATTAGPIVDHGPLPGSLGWSHAAPLRVRVDRRLAGPLPGLLCLAGRLAQLRQSAEALPLLAEGGVVAFQLGDPALQVASCRPQLATLGAPGARGAPGQPQQQRTQQAEPGGDQQQLALGEAGDRLVEDGN